MEFQIDHLMDHPEHTRLVAEWIYREFWQGRDRYSADDLEGLLRQATDRERIPLSLIAVAGGRPVGTVNLIDNDDPTRPQLHPWLAALLVIPEYRGRGIGAALVRALLGEAKRLGYEEVFLGADIPAFYSRLGAEHFEQATETLSILRFRLPGAGSEPGSQAGLNSP